MIWYIDTNLDNELLKLRKETNNFSLKVSFCENRTEDQLLGVQFLIEELNAVFHMFQAIFVLANVLKAY